MNMDDISKLAQSCFQSNPTLILGSGASMSHGLPSMGDLQKYLHDSIATDGTVEEDSWLLVKTALSQGDHLEAALEGKAIPASLVDKIVLRLGLV